MSVIGKEENEDYFTIFCKGSPEKLKKLCLNETIPANFKFFVFFPSSKF